MDAALNNYVALHYASRHMSWLHCMWGVGASVGPYIMSYALAGGGSWQNGYRIISLLQIGLTLVLLLSLPLWKGSDAAAQQQAPALSLRQVLAIPGAKQVMGAFFCYCAIEQTTSLWASSYLVLARGVDEITAARWAALFFLGITAGRAASGFLTMLLSDTQMIRLGQGILAAGIFILWLPVGSTGALVGLLLIGLGCAPIYPCIIHSTPAHFGADRSQALIGVQMASAYTGTCLMPPLFGLIANHIQVGLLPVFLLLLLVLMAFLYQQLTRCCAVQNPVH